MGADSEQQMVMLDDLLSRLQRVMHMKSSMGTGLTASQIFILRYLDRLESAKASDIAKTAGLSPGAVTQVCDELVRLGLAERTRSEVDRRVVQIFLTQSGREQLEKIRAEGVGRLFGVIRELDSEDIDAFVRVLGKIVDVVERKAKERG